MKFTKVLEWEKNGVKYEAIKAEAGALPSIGEWWWYNGYCTLPVILPDVNDVDVHGGVTYTKDNGDGTMTYGFDCAHVYDDENPNSQDLEWIKAEAERMAASILDLSVERE